MPQDDDAEKDRQEEGEREQGVKTEDSNDLSSPQFTEDAEPREERARDR
jgi:hypothetical protein